MRKHPHSQNYHGGRRTFSYIHVNQGCICNTWKYLHKPINKKRQVSLLIGKLEALLLQSKSQGWSPEGIFLMHSIQPARSLHCKQKSHTVNGKGSAKALQEKSEKPKIWSSCWQKDHFSKNSVIYIFPEPNPRCNLKYH